jgi:hypothetical protein
MNASPSTFPGDECRIDALHALDRVLEDRSHDLDSVLIRTTQCLVRYRDALIARLREGPDAAASDELRYVNAALSLLFGTHYPLVGIQWERLKKAREALSELAA